VANLTKSVPTLSCLILLAGLAASAKADTIITLQFTGTATCGDPTCSAFGSGPLTGIYNLDVTKQAIVGTWSFSTPFGIISSTQTGAITGVQIIDGEPGSYFDILTATPPFDDAVGFYFPPGDTQQIGALSVDVGGVACNNVPGEEACSPGYTVTGSTVVAPEPSSLMSLGVGMLSLVGLNLLQALGSRPAPANAR
jgi:hypothetical protein